MFAGAAREAVFSNPDVIKKVKEEFVPVALKAALVNGMLGGDGPEEQLVRRIGRSKLVPQGICVADSDGRPLEWALSFDDEKAAVAFLEHSRERFSGEGHEKAERFMRFPSEKKEDWKDEGPAIHVPLAHTSPKECPGTARVPHGALVVRVVGRALDASGAPCADGTCQDRYVEDRFEIPEEPQRALAAALSAEGSKRVRIPGPIAGTLVSHAFLGQLDVAPSLPGSDVAFELFVEKTDQGLRISGDSRARRGDSGRPGDGASMFHEVQLSWEGFMDLKDGRIARLVLAGRGREKLVWRSGGFDGDKGRELAHLPAGRALDFEGDVRYGLVGETIPDADAVDEPLPSKEHAIQEKMQKLQEGMQAWQRAGRDPTPIARTVEERFMPLIHEGKIEEAEAVLDGALAALGGATAAGGAGGRDAPRAAENGPDPLAKVHERLVQVHRRIEELVRAGKIDEAEKALDRALQALEEKR